MVAKVQLSYGSTGLRDKDFAGRSCPIRGLCREAISTPVKLPINVGLASNGRSTAPNQDTASQDFQQQLAHMTRLPRVTAFCLKEGMRISMPSYPDANGYSEVGAADPASLTGMR